MWLVIEDDGRANSIFGPNVHHYASEDDAYAKVRALRVDPDKRNIRVRITAMGDIPEAVDIEASASESGNVARLRR